MDENEKELVRDRTDIVELISAYTTLKQVGNSFKGLCPFHQERTPSFHVMPERRRYHCFGCGASGDVFTFLEKKENLTFLEAAERLAMRAGITLSRKGVNPEEIRRQQSERDRLFAANAAAVRFFRAAYRRAGLAQEYAATRGLVHDTLESFGIGYAPDDWGQLAHFLLEREKIHSEDAIRAGLITASRRMEGEFTDRFRGRFMFPIVDVQERVIGFGGRLIVDKPDPKYLNSPETPIFSKSKTLYALNRARKAIQEQDVAVIVEGYMDVIASHQAGISCVVATLGTAMTADHVALLRRYTKNIVLSFDADTAGVKAALKAAELISGAGTDMVLKVLSLPPGEDPDSLIRKGNAAGFRKAIDNAVTVPEFQLGILRRECRIASSDDCILFLRQAAAVIAPLDDSLQINALIVKVASIKEVLSFISAREAERVVRGEVARLVALRSGHAPTDNTDGSIAFLRRESGYEERPTWNRQYRREYRPDRSQPLPSPSAQRPHAAEEAERTLIRAIFSEEFLPIVRRMLRSSRIPLRFVNPLAEQVILLFESSIYSDAEPRDIFERLDNPEIAGFVDAVLSSPVWADSKSRLELHASMVSDAINELRKRSVESDSGERADIVARIAANGGKLSPDDINDLKRMEQVRKALRNRSPDSGNG
jgi:DNA primase catalytic core